nr:hypothetical protein [Desulfuromonadales bacterium]
MERLLELRALLRETPTLGFFDQRLFMVLPMKGDSFEAGGLFGDFADPDVGVEVFRE